ncbi:MAG: Rieske 2Fe-2S domain-containing protein [Chloroflexi bacterium]|nr:Rieske 2Fe-2S domain-containing protein [Chloroflexota bacterium]
MLARVGKITDIGAGQMRVVRVGDAKVSLANVGGTFYAFDDTCTHQGCSLASGELSGTTVTCPCHGREFDVRSGEVLEGPADEPVATAVEIDGDDIVVRSPA